MGEGESIGNMLRRLKDRSGLSLQDIADRMEMKRATVQRYFDPDYRVDGVLDVDLALKLATALVGEGEPAISKDDLLDLTGLPQVGARGESYTPLSYEVAEAMAETVARLALGGKDPPVDVVEAIAKTLTSLTALYESEPEARLDPNQTRGALKVLYRQFAPPANESQPG